jgi:hypothetical protein
VTDLPTAEDTAIEMIRDPDTDAVSVVARGPDGALLAFELGDPDLEYQDFVELAAYHLISLENQSDKDPEDTLRDVIQARNDLRRERDVSGGDIDS